MESMLLTPYDGAFLGPIAKVLGWIMEVVYNFMYNTFGIENVGLSIIILTIVIYTLMLPFTVKQQKFSKLMQKIQPEIKEIQDKYKNRKDQEAQMAMSQEMQFVYDKYGVSPMGSCWQMLIQMPIWFALFRVFYNIAGYIGTVRDKFSVIADEIMQYEGFADILTKIQTELKITLNVAPDFVVSDTNTAEQVKNFVIDIISKVPSLDQLITPNANGEQYFTALESVTSIMNSEGGLEAFHQYNYFMGLNIADNPWNIILSSFGNQNYLLVFVALALPLVYYFVQKYSLKLTSTTTNKKDEQNDMMAQQMKMMNKTMPLVMVFMCFITPVGLGIYWVASSAYRVVQQLILNKYFENIDVQKIIKKNEAKAAKKREKMGVYENQIREAAAMRTRTLSNKANYDNSAAADIESQIDRANDLKTTAKPGSLSAKANMVRDYNERNSRK